MQNAVGTESEHDRFFSVGLKCKSEEPHADSNLIAFYKRIGNDGKHRRISNPAFLLVIRPTDRLHVQIVKLGVASCPRSPQ